MGRLWGREGLWIYGLLPLLLTNTSFDTSNSDVSMVIGLKYDPGIISALPKSFHLKVCDFVEKPILPIILYTKTMIWLVETI